MAELVGPVKGVVASCIRTLQSAGERLDDWIDGLDGMSEVERQRVHAERDSYAENAAFFPKAFPFMWH